MYLQDVWALWPYLLFAFVFAIAFAAWYAFKEGDETSLGKVKLDKIRNSAAVVSAGAAFSIPIVIFIAASNNQSATLASVRETETLRLMNDVDERISKITAQKDSLDAANRKALAKDAPPLQIYSYDYISRDSNTEVKNEVRKLLNAYEFICVGVNKGLLDIEVVKKMRMDALVLTFRLDYRMYINRVHEDYRYVNTWSDCVELAKKLEPEVRNNNSMLAAELAKLDEEEKKPKSRSEWCSWSKALMCLECDSMRSLCSRARFL